jgi:hypothetical protein
MRFVGAGVLGGREDTVCFEQLHQDLDGRAGMVRPRRVAAREVPVAQHRGVADLWGRPGTPEKRARLRDELNAAMREQSSRAQGPGLARELREGLQLGTEARAEEGLIVVHCEYAVAHGQRGTIVEVRSSSILGEQCRVTWADGRTGCYSTLELKTSGHKRMHGAREDIHPPPTRPGPAPYCMGDRQFDRPRGLMPRNGPPQALCESKECAPGAFRVYRYQPGAGGRVAEVHKKNQTAIHDDLMQKADGWR